MYKNSDFSDSDSENGENKISKPRFFQKFQNFFSKKFQKNFFSKKFFFRLEKHSQVASALKSQKNFFLGQIGLEFFWLPRPTG